MALDPQFVNTLAIVKYPDPRLRAVCAPVVEFGDDLRRLTERMVQLMNDRNGVGLAGPQVGIMQRLFVCNPTGEPGDNQILINPQLSNLEGAAEGEEGCLSIPDVLVPIRRAQRCTIQAQDVEGNPFELTGQDLQARVWQHEHDHLQGKLILDYMNEASHIANRRIIKQLEASFNA
ncbi:MAG: peptide deformylase [Planctomycetota bacterium]|nr:peptide deformylase [Planctomycetota bacterium]